MLIGFIITGFFLKVLLLTNFKQCDEDCPVPEDVRDTLGEFHNNLLLHCGEKILVSLQVWISFYVKYLWVLMLNSHFIGIHIEEEAEEEEVDTSLRGRLLSLVDKVKNLRKKEEEEKPEVEEEPKPSKSNS